LAYPNAECGLRIAEFKTKKQHGASILRPALRDYGGQAAPAYNRHFRRAGLPITRREVNPSTPHHKCWGLLRVDPEWRFFTPPSKAGLGATEWVKSFTGMNSG